MEKQKAWLNGLAALAFVVFLLLWAWWLFRHQQPMPFVLRAKWRVQDFALSLTFSPKGDLLAALVVNFAKHGQRVFTVNLTVNLWQVQEGRTVLSPIVISQRLDLGGMSSRRSFAFSPDGRLLAVGYQEQKIGKVGVFNRLVVN